MVVVADTSFLFALYGNDVHSIRAVEWCQKTGMAILVSEFTEYELGNAFRFAAFRKLIPPELAARYWADYEADRDAERIVRMVSNLGRVLATAKRLSATHTPLAGIGASTFSTWRRHSR